MKKLVLLLCFVFALGLVSVNAQDFKAKTPVKTEKKAPVKKAPVKKAPVKKAPVKKHKAPVKK